MQQLKDQIEDLQIDLKKAAEEKETLTQQVEEATKAVSLRSMFDLVDDG